MIIPSLRKTPNPQWNYIANLNPLPRGTASFRNHFAQWFTLGSLGEVLQRDLFFILHSSAQIKHSFVPNSWTENIICTWPPGRKSSIDKVRGINGAKSRNELNHNFKIKNLSLTLFKKKKSSFVLKNFFMTSFQRT